MNWTEPYAYLAESTPLADVLRAFASSHGLALKFDGALPASRVNARIRAPSAAAFLDLVLPQGVDWFVFNGALHIGAGARRVETIDLGSLDVEDAKQALVDVGLFDARFGWGQAPGRGVVLVSGPPAYVALVRQLLGRLKREHPRAPAARSAARETMVFRLQNAWADDRDTVINGQRVTVPGVATQLRALMQGGRTPIEPSSGWAMFPNLYAASQQPPPLPDGWQAGGPAAPAPAGEAEPAIVADVQTNSVIVRDVAQRRSEYERLVAQLDAWVARIDVEAALLEFDPADAARVERAIDGVTPAPVRNAVSIDRLKGIAGDKAQWTFEQLIDAGVVRVRSRQRSTVIDRSTALLDLSAMSAQVAAPGGASQPRLPPDLALCVTPTIAGRAVRLDVETVYPATDAKGPRPFPCSARESGGLRAEFAVGSGQRVRVAGGGMVDATRGWAVVVVVRVRRAGAAGERADQRVDPDRPVAGSGGEPAFATR
ncbi:secretin N-terminal domain-containing protein [Trinickia mobilis]|uniref:secretin N-terminal domain-containing protein n=1 Tax=Trinickia mobilis TaxID=2816356 RepID=UPI001A8CCF04|nr:secretin N-terminal domain-containing protein [Trinickia mobilis]